MNEKVDEYFKLLHPDAELETLSEEEYKRALSDRTLIEESINMVEAFYNGLVKKGYGPVSAIKTVVNHLKGSKYRDILFSDEMDFVQEEKFSKKQQLAYDKRREKLGKKIDFVREHVDEIDKYYQACVNGKNGTRYEGMTEQQILQEAIDRVREATRENDVTIDESKYEKIYGKAKGRLKQTVLKIKSLFNMRSNDRTDKENDETIK